MKKKKRGLRRGDRVVTTAGARWECDCCWAPPGLVGTVKDARGHACLVEWDPPGCDGDHQMVGIFKGGLSLFTTGEAEPETAIRILA